MGILAAMKGWKTISGLASLIVALLFKDGTLGDGGAASQMTQYVMVLLGGGMTIGGVIDKIRREAVEKAAAAIKEKTGSSTASQMMSKVIGDILDVVTADLKNCIEPLPTPEEVNAVRTKAQESMCNYESSAAQKASEQMAGYTPMPSEKTRKTREPASMVNSVMMNAAEETTETIGEKN